MKDTELNLTEPGRYRICGAPEGVDARALAALARNRGGAVLHVARDDARMAALGGALDFFAADLPVLQVPAWDCLPYDRVSPNADLSARRMDSLGRLAGRTEDDGPLVVLTTVNAMLQRLPSRDFVAEARFPLKVGERLDREALQTYLVHAGYHRVGQVMEPGEFAFRGGLIDLYPPGGRVAGDGAEDGGGDPLRIDLFGDEIEALRSFDALSQRTTGRLKAFTLQAASELSLDEGSVQRFRQGYRALFGAVTDSDPLYAAVSEGRKHPGMEHWLPLFHERLEPLTAYLPGAAVTLDHLAEEARDERLDAIADFYAARKEGAEDGAGDHGSPYKPLPPDRLYLSAADWDAGLAGRVVASFTPYREPDATARTVDLEGTQGRDFAPERTQGANVYEALRDHLNDLRKVGRRRILIASYSPGARDRLKTVLGDHGVEGLVEIDDAAAIPAPGQGIGIAVMPLERGFADSDLVTVTEQDLLGDRLSRPRRRSRRAENFLAEASQIAPGDHVVHVDHGIGRYEGLRTLEIGGAPHDCLLLVYDGDDKLYLPVENIEVLSRYASEDAHVALDKLGGTGWQGRKARLKKRLKDMAEELLKVAAKRALRRAPAMLPPHGAYDEFAARFPFQETEDQARAIEDTIDDLGSGTPMDRLVCGDVGFGKTEVALRAAFVAAVEGKQVALVCPTTLLARQHFQTFRDRFRDLPVRVEQLSRLVPPKAARAIRKDMVDGKVDIIIGTHALLSKSIQFGDLGLLIIDEEQHFGVRHKERLKQLRSDVHVLTLSATPIPRTLQLAMSGLRELSLIATPPVDRLAVRTFVMPFDSLIVREALLREHYRGGQSFYVCPRVADLAEARDYLTTHVPEVKAVAAHGQMAPTELEDVMTAFYEGQYDVLLSTNIVESGLDIPRANTLVVHRADMFGLAQLYQLRGRIGRSKIRGYAYFTLPARRQPTANAERRLKVLQTLDTLGAGFSLASHDLDIRGAGNLLGEEQSGHIREVGFELYQEMLQEAMATARGEGAAEDEGRWSPQITLGNAVLIPEDYVADLNLRLQLYRRIARLADEAEIEDFMAEMVDRFGPMPEEMRHLLDIVAIKQACFRANVEKIDAGPKGCTIAFRNDSFANPAGLIHWIGQEPGQAKLRPDHKLVILREWTGTDDRVKGVQRLVARLADIADAAEKDRKILAG